VARELLHAVIMQINFTTPIPPAATAAVARPLLREVASQWSESLARHASTPGARHGMTPPAHASRKRLPVLSSEEFIDASLAMIVSKRLVSR
jgi:hypothetical protein